MEGSLAIMESDTTPAVELHPEPPGTGKKIVVVDHSKLARKIIREELEADGFAILAADHADEVYSILATTPVEAITLSVELAGQNGYEISSRVNSEEFIHSPQNASGRRLPIVFITSKDTLEGRKHGFESGAADFVSKPFVKGEVSNSIKKILFPESRMQGLTAVVVDDGILSRQIVANYLSSLGVIVLEASNGDEGFRLIRENIEHVDM